jgi:hypothetical protein
MPFASMIVIPIFQHELMDEPCLAWQSGDNQRSLVALEVPPETSHRLQNIANLFGSASNIVTAAGPGISISVGIPQPFLHGSPYNTEWQTPISRPPPPLRVPPGP